MSKTIIKIENLSKQYRLGTIGTGTIAHDLNRWWKTNIMGKEDPYLKIGETNDRAHKGLSEYVWALRDINLEVKEGDVVGIIGKNGAGKSTLLKILSRVTAPTTGSIKVNGRLGSLLEVGTGFHPELTGRENIFLNGAILGMTKAEIRSKLDEIIDFSGCERYIDTPVKRYSSGMNVRLGFAVAAFLEPEILVVDEVLAVGDAEFQKKAIGKMQDVSQNHGRTVLFVSHNMGSMAQLCKTGLLLINGKNYYTGNIDNTINTYLKNKETNKIYKSKDKPYQNYINELYLHNGNNCAINNFRYDEEICINCNFKIKEQIKNSTLTLFLYNRQEQLLFTSHLLIDEKYEIGIHKKTAKLPVGNLLPGNYYLKAKIHVPNHHNIDNDENTLELNIVDTGNEQSSYKHNVGLFSINVKW